MRSPKCSGRKWRGSTTDGRASRSSGLGSQTSWSRETTRHSPYWKDTQLRKWNLWGYVDARDVAQSCRLALEKPTRGAEAFIIAAADTVMNRPSKALMAEVYPSVSLRGEVGEFETLLSIKKARSVLGYSPRWSWRDHLK